MLRTESVPKSIPTTQAAPLTIRPALVRPSPALLAVPRGLDVRQDGGVGCVRRPAHRDGAFEEGAERMVAVVAPDAQDYRPLVVPLLGRGAVVSGRQRGGRLRVGGPDRVLPGGGLEDAEGVFDAVHRGVH